MCRSRRKDATELLSLAATYTSRPSGLMATEAAPRSPRPVAHPDLPPLQKGGTPLKPDEYQTSKFTPRTTFKVGGNALAGP